MWWSVLLLCCHASLASSTTHEHYPHTTHTHKHKTPSPPPAPIISSTTENIVTVYLLIDKIDTLQQYIDDLNSVAKVNFNRIIFSFIKPTLTDYQSGSLANTGLLGYFYEGDGNGISAFELLRSAIVLSKEKAIQTFLSVGGWNYSCKYESYGSRCGDPPSVEQGIYYDFFPDPTLSSESDIAQVAYTNIIRLVTDLGAEGIDVDAEEFWHADESAVVWNGNPWATSLAYEILDNGGPSYENLMTYGTGASTPSGPAVMPATVSKMTAILKLLQGSNKLLFSSAAPPVGARPITGFVYGDTSPEIYTAGGLWWLGNLKGLWYHLSETDLSLVSRFDSLGLMTYDLCGVGADCAPYADGPTDLPGQVNAYMTDYLTWLKAASPSSANLTVNPTDGKVTFLPQKFNLKTTKIQFGFEVSQPAYPKEVSGQLQLTDELVDTILAQQQDQADGVIIWEMYSLPNVAANGTTARYTINQSCKTFLSKDGRYDCGAAFPSTPPQPQVQVQPQLRGRRVRARR
jgi:hypothetical protein